MAYVPQLARRCTFAATNDTTEGRLSNLISRMEAAQKDRRRTARFVTDISVVLRTVLGNRSCHMSNISDKGAKLETSSPPPEGIAACLVMGEQEIYCKVIWSKEDACGVEFDRAIPDRMLHQIAHEEVKKTGPVANVGRIQPGRKRAPLVPRPAS